MSDEKNRFIAETLEPEPEFPESLEIIYPSESGLWAQWSVDVDTDKAIPAHYHSNGIAHIALQTFITSPAMDERFPGWRVRRISIDKSIIGNDTVVGLDCGHAGTIYQRAAPDHMTAFRDACWEMCKAMKEEEQSDTH